MISRCSHGNIHAACLLFRLPPVVGSEDVSDACLRVCCLQEMKEAAGEEEAELAEEMAQAFLSENLPETMFGAPKAGPGMWASVIRVMDPADGRTTHMVRLEQNEAALRWVHPWHRSYTPSCGAYNQADTTRQMMTRQNDAG